MNFILAREAFFKIFPFFFIVFLALVFFNSLLSTDEVIYSPASDLVQNSLRWKNFIHQNFQAGLGFPYWHNLSFIGYPLIGVFVISPFYPLDVLHFYFPPFLVFNFEVILSFVLLGFFTFLFLRELKLSRFPSLFGAVAFMFSGKLLAHLYAGHIMIINALVWVPLLFFLTERLAKRRNFESALLLGIVFGIQILAGFLQMFFFTFCFLALYFILRFYHLNYPSSFGFSGIKHFAKSLAPVLVLAVIAVVLGLMLGAVQLLPSFELKPYSLRFAETGEFSFKHASSISLDPPNLIMLVFPHFFGSALDDSFVWSGAYFWALTSYVGIITLLLVIVALLFKRNFFVIFFSIAALLSVLFALGDNTPFFALLYYSLPIFSLLRAPARIMFFFAFFTSIISAFGVAFLVSKMKLQERKLFSKFTVFTIALLMISALATIVIFLAKPQIISFGEKIAEQSYNASLPHANSLSYWLAKVPLVYNHMLIDTLMLSILLFLSFVVFFAVLRGVSLKKVKFFLLAILLFDLWFFAMPFIQTKLISEVLLQNDVIGFLKQDNSYYRILDFERSQKQEAVSFHGIQMVLGYEAEWLAGIDDLAGLLGNDSSKGVESLAVLGMLNGKYVVSSTPLENENLKLVFSGSSLVYENSLNLPRAFTLGNFKVLDSEKKVLEEMSNPEFDFKKTILLSKQPSINTSTEAFKEAEITLYTPNRIEIEAEIAQPALLFVSEAYYPSWRAFDNGKEVEILKANHALRAVSLEPGKHKVIFEFKPDSLSQGLAISLTALAIISILLFFLFYRKRFLK